MSIFTQDAIRRAVDEMERTSATHLAKHMNLSVSTTSKYLKSLAAQGLIGQQVRNYRRGIDAVMYFSKKGKS